MSQRKPRRTPAPKKRSGSSARKACSVHGPTCSEHYRSFWFDEEAAARAVEFIESYCTHVKGELAGQPFVLEPWQKDEIIRPLFGWKRPDGLRRYRKVYVEVPRKNGKSLAGSAIALLLLFADGESGAEIYSAAADRDQAAIVFDVAKLQAEASEDLRTRCEMYRRSIVVRSTASSYHVLSADVPTKHGKNPHGIIFDELHAQPNRDLYDVLATGMGARRQPLLVMFTTAGYDRNSICWEEHDYALKVRAGIVDDPSYLGVVYAADPEDDWTDPKVWAKANPNLGVSVKLAFLEDECRKAQESPAAQNTFRRLYLNQWTEQNTRWIDIAAWDDNPATLDADELRGRRCFAGLDLATTTDIAAMVLVFPPADDDEDVRVLPFFWVPEDNARTRSRRDRVPYEQWIRDGFIQATPGNVIDYDFIRERVGQLAEKFEIVEVGYDPWNAQQLVTQLQSDGLEMVPVRQGAISLSAPTKELEKLVISRKLNHGGNPVLRWMMSNVSVRADAAGNIKPDKAKSSERIDGIVALVMALSRASVADEGGSVYDERGISAV